MSYIYAIPNKYLVITGTILGLHITNVMHEHKTLRRLNQQVRSLQQAQDKLAEEVRCLHEKIDINT